ncbi:hypothetical protein MHYP_G00014900 [Metynnis hypsauchen]
MSSALYLVLLFSALWTLSFCGTRQFHVVNEYKNWADAQKYCREKFADLATIESQEEMNAVITVLNKATGDFWIGLKQKDKQGNSRTWMWSDGSQFSYSNWNSGEPNNPGSNNCGALQRASGYRWNDAGCLWFQQFVCQEVQDLPLLLIKDEKTWWEALRYCRGNHVDLVSVHTEKIQNWVETMTKNASTANVWMGLRHACAQSFWFWVNGSTVCYQNWAPGNGTGVEDCSGGERSGAVQSGSKQWVSLPEGQRLNFICTTTEESVKGRQSRLSSLMSASSWEGRTLERHINKDRPVLALVSSSVTAGDTDTDTNRAALPAVTVMSSALYLVLLFSALWNLSFCGTRQFHVVNESKNWTDAQKHCREKFTDLVTIESQEEMNTVIAALNGKTDDFWIGKTQKVKQSWIWSDGSNSSYTNWNDEEPNNGVGEVCVEVQHDSTYKWNDENCNQPNPFICYKELPLILIKEKKTWREALRYCRVNHVDLVSVHTEEIQHWVETAVLYASTANVWMGLRHTCTLSFWFWVSGESICYQNWAPGNGTGVEDCSGGERAGAMQSGSKQWVSLPEDQRLNFICTIKEF